MSKERARDLITVAIGTLLVLYAIWKAEGAYPGAPNHPLVATYTGVNPYASSVTVEFTNFYKDVRVYFDVYTQVDTVLDVNIPSPAVSNLAKTTNKRPDPNGVGWLTEYTYIFSPPDANTWNVDIIMTDTTNQCRPQWRHGAGISQATGSWWDKAAMYVQDANFPATGSGPGRGEGGRQWNWMRGTKIARYEPDKAKRIEIAYLSGQEFDGPLVIPQGYE